ncbi:hypothetical protein [Streptomyces sp. NPDC007063]|uniref:hypothetical protein n=1 Tax=Streptomyces sp. NPDC007063 TaxID=3364772 RepID=UPI0036C4CE15
MTWRAIPVGQGYRRALAPSGPDTGTRLVHRCLADLLLHPDTPVRSRELMRRAAHEGVAVRARYA